MRPAQTALAQSTVDFTSFKPGTALDPKSRAVGINSFSSAKMWKIAFVIAIPLALTQIGQITIIANAITNLGKVLGN